MLHIRGQSRPGSAWSAQGCDCGQVLRDQTVLVQAGLDAGGGEEVQQDRRDPGGIVDHAGQGVGVQIGTQCLDGQFGHLRAGQGLDPEAGQSAGPVLAVQPCCERVPVWGRGGRGLVGVVDQDDQPGGAGLGQQDPQERQGHRVQILGILDGDQHRQQRSDQPEGPPVVLGAFHGRLAPVGGEGGATGAVQRLAQQGVPRSPHPAGPPAQLASIHGVVRVLQQAPDRGAQGAEATQQKHPVQRPPEPVDDQLVSAGHRLGNRLDMGNQLRVAVQQGEASRTGGQPPPEERRGRSRPPIGDLDPIGLNHELALDPCGRRHPFGEHPIRAGRGHAKVPGLGIWGYGPRTRQAELGGPVRRPRLAHRELLVHRLQHRSLPHPGQALQHHLMHPVLNDRVLPQPGQLPHQAHPLHSNDHTRIVPHSPRLVIEFAVVEEHRARFA